jgi:hypothetical protein
MIVPFWRTPMSVENVMGMRGEENEMRKQRTPEWIWTRLGREDERRGGSRANNCHLPWRVGVKRDGE